MRDQKAVFFGQLCRTHWKRLSFSSSAELRAKRLQRRKWDKKSISDPEGFGLGVKITPTPVSQKLRKRDLAMEQQLIQSDSQTDSTD